MSDLSAIERHHRRRSKAALWVDHSISETSLPVYDIYGPHCWALIPVACNRDYAAW